MSYKPSIVQLALYVLKLENGCYYIGVSNNLNFRLSQHIEGKGAQWTKNNKFRSVSKLIFPATDDMENRVTLEYMEKYGVDKVRGGDYCRVFYNYEPELHRFRMAREREQEIERERKEREQEEQEEQNVK